MDIFAPLQLRALWKRGTWYSTVRDRARIVKIICPRCGATVPLLRHRIDRAGLVKPKVGCGCGYEKSAFLAGWAFHE
jgi:ribosomal protein S27AE